MYFYQEIKGEYTKDLDTTDEAVENSVLGGVIFIYKATLGFMDDKIVRPIIRLVHR